ncbi:hypothetical protein BDW74DRAFT_182208 [Aspergillus multicolor]|uniref:uncharacterized protein n=1 Tax=Aspergillus multicolor TaxID=41759 RepID=UPI003CCCD5AB
MAESTTLLYLTLPLLDTFSVWTFGNGRDARTPETKIEEKDAENQETVPAMGLSFSASFSAAYFFRLHVRILPIISPFSTYNIPITFTTSPPSQHTSLARSFISPTTQHKSWQAVQQQQQQQQQLENHRFYLDDT